MKPESLKIANDLTKRIEAKKEKLREFEKIRDNVSNWNFKATATGCSDVYLGLTKSEKLNIVCNRILLFKSEIRELEREIESL